jgi:hypothetical protein
VTNGSNVIIDQFPVTVMPSGYVLICKDVTFTSTPIANFALSVKDAAGTAASDKTFGVTRSDATACTGTTYTYTFEYLDPSAGYTTTNPYSTYFSLNAASGILTYKSPPASFMNGLTIMTVNCRLTATFVSWPAKTVVQYLTITLNNVCATTSFTAVSTQAAYTYEDGSSATDSITAFTYTLGALTATECALTHTIAFKDASTDTWLTAPVPAYVLSSDAATLAFSIKTTTASIATSGDTIASRWVQRTHYNPYSKETIKQEFQIFFVKSKFCMAKTASLIASSLDLTDYVVGSGARAEPV